MAIINWNGARLLRACLEPLADAGYQVIVVDNGSADESVHLLRADFSWAEVVENAQNLGFAAANNQVLARAKGKYVLLLNNDTVPSLAAVEETIEFLEEHPAAAIAGPTLIYPDGTRQRSCGPGPSIWTEFLAKTLLHRLIRIRELAPKRSRRVDWVTGAALMIRGDVARDLGGLDAGMFMYYEDLDLCARARREGHEVWFVATSEPIVHLGGGSSRNVRAASLVHSYESADRYFSRHGPPWRRRLLRGLTVVESILRSVLWLGIAVNADRRPEARDRLRAYRTIFRRALRDDL